MPIEQSHKRIRWVFVVVGFREDASRCPDCSKRLDGHGGTAVTMIATFSWWRKCRSRHGLGNP
ncbi:MAG: hypothetical protein IT494_02780 [Gammaproteobacteria bacterium]|nr:hypothetical protein [Gammaproteobacteria bacterium]